MKHRHPVLAKPVSPERLEAELAAVWARGRRGQPPRIVPTEALSKTHGRNPRRYCETNGEVIFVAPQILRLPRAQRLGLIAHELGHVVLLRRRLWGHSERAADRTAERVFGVEVTYDLRWPGRGLQSGRRR